MPYLGNVPAENYAQVSYQDLTGGSGTSFTLDYPVGSAGEIEVFVNNVRQEPTVAYTVNGTALTMTGSIAATDDFYVVFQGKAEKSGTIPEKQSDGTYVFPDDVTVSGNITLGDNNKAIFGAGSDLQIYHDGVHSYIDEAGTGDIYVSVLDDVVFRTYGTNELVARFNTNQSTGGWARLYHRGSEKLETTSTGVDVTGTITPSGGVYLGGTGSANLLDDYETGTWTPVYKSSSGSHPTITYGIQVGVYVKIGDMVHVQGRVRTDAVSGGGGFVELQGLPFTNTSPSDAYSVLSIGYCTDWTNTNFPSTGFLQTNNTAVRLIKFNTSEPRGQRNLGINVADLNTTAGDNDILFSMTYKTD